MSEHQNEAHGIPDPHDPQQPANMPAETPAETVEMPAHDAGQSSNLPPAPSVPPAPPLATQSFGGAHETQPLPSSQPLHAQHGVPSHDRPQDGQHYQGHTGQGHTGEAFGPTAIHQGSTYPETYPQTYPQTSPYGVAVAPSPQQERAPRKRYGAGVVVAGMIIAALVGGGTAAAGTAFFGAQASTSTPAAQNGNAPLIVNNTAAVNAVTAAAQKASPSVVTIGVTSGSSGGTGSGIILDTNGNILTNTHVVTLDGQVANPSIEVRLNDGRVFAAKVVGTDPLNDLAVIKIDAPSLVPAELGDSSKINVGDTAIAIGAPLGLSGTVTDGIVSTLNRTISVASSAAPQGQDSGGNSGGTSPYKFAPPNGGSQSPNSTAQSSISLNVIQTDAAINPGNSGGALVNSQGQVIGINVAIAGTGSSSSSSASGSIGVGFSIPINTAKRVAQEIVATGKATHGQLGVSVKPQAANGSSNSSSSANGSSSSFTIGALVSTVDSGSPAGKAGIQVGDVITNVGSRVIDDASSLTAAVREQAGGATVKVTFLRNGKSQSVDVTLGTASTN
ncbi:S1C family serine protease [Psychromicrobium xiongbiense]|uniref:S1C family serine protease n=1 Tax=Psychromicrobium xiongbiense TaxID=3051184 RepID=UPI0025542783|nr:trypsin-like peptidase domain-containing protein [Psychromicrobium sp. YIM S02556]